MDRWRAGSPLYSRQQSAGSSSSGSSSPAMSPHHRRSGSGSGASLSSFRRTQNLAARAANARLAQVMASQAADNGDEDDDEAADGGGGLAGADAGFRFAPPRPSVSGNGGGGGYFFGRSARSPSPALGRNFVEPTPTVRSTSSGRPSLTVRTTLVPPSKPTVRSASPVLAMEPPVDRRRDRRFFADVGHLNSREPSDVSEELDLLQDENENLLEKLRLAEERCAEAEARSRELEKQVANLGEGVSLEARLLSRKEAALRQREEAVKAAMQTKEYDKSEEVASLRSQVQSARDEVATTMEQLKAAESEAKDLRTMTQRMILTKEEMDEVALKKCWLAWYWGLAVRHGIYQEIATSKHEHWLCLAPVPFEYVISAGERAKEESWSQGDGDSERRNNPNRDLNDITGEGNIESMLLVEKGLRELASLKVEDAVLLAMAELRGRNLLRQSNAELKSPSGPKVMEAFELSEDEVKDVLFKQAWLTYIWRRAKTHGVEEDIAEERLQFWINRSGQSPTFSNAVDVERGLMEVRKLGIEELLWEASRRDIDGNQKLTSYAEKS